MAVSAAPFDARATAAEVRRIGKVISPAVLEASQALYAPYHEREPYAGVRIARDIAYGSHERQRLDVFEPDAAGHAPVLVFVHGGGFVGGDKKRPGTPFHDNVALWAVRHGLVGVNMTYRLAPQFPWPAGAEDVAAALAWTRANISRHGGDPGRIFLMGTSAGAVHAASYVAHSRFHPRDGAGLAGAILLSGLYNIATAERNAVLTAYFGRDPEQHESCSSLQGLLESRTPLLYSLSELDPADFERQALELVNAWFTRHGRWPHFTRLMGHNHFTATLQLNTPDDCLGRALVDFIGI